MYAVWEAALEVDLRGQRARVHEPRAIRELRVEQVAHAALIRRRLRGNTRFVQRHQHLAGGIGVTGAVVELRPAAVRLLRGEQGVDGRAAFRLRVRAPR